MATLTIRLRTDDDRDVLTTLKAAMHEPTSSGALMRAARDWPGMVQELDAERARATRLEGVLAAILDAETELDDARARRSASLQTAAEALGCEDVSVGAG